MAPSPEVTSPGDDYFNDLNQQPAGDGEENTGERRGSKDDGDNEQVPKPKRIACILCRKRKLRCDGTKPSCATCTRLQHDCSYDEVRRKSGPKRGYVKALEARLAQVETLLNKQDDPPKKAAPSTTSAKVSDAGLAAPDYASIAIGSSNADLLSHLESAVNRHEGPTQTAFPHSLLGSLSGTTPSAMPQEEAFPWEMIGLGLDEPLPNQDVVNELNQAYFDKIHPSLPMIQRARYYAAMNLSPHMRPPVCLRYAMWANAAAVSDKYEPLQEHFYQRARKYIQQDEMKGHGESMITTAHCQTWCLIATYEFKLMYFPRAWVSAGRACRLSQMMGMHRIDGAGLDVKQCLPPAKDPSEREERRRTFWMSFCVDRYSSIGTGWPMTIEEQDIMTCLPGDELSYETGKSSTTMTLEEALRPEGAPRLTGFGGVVVMACMFGRNLTHLHRPSEEDKDADLNGEFWKRHRSMDNILLNTALALPENCRLPSGLNDPNVVFMNMNIHTSTICLHQAAIFKADKNRMPARISAESKVRCITAAAEIASIMRTVSHVDLSSMNPFISFCLYVAARVFVQYLKSRPKDTQVKSSLQFLLTAMHAIKRKNPLTESFLVQLDVDLEGAGLEDTKAFRSMTQSREARVCPTQHAPQVNHPKFKYGAYGDHGLGKYNDANNVLDPTVQTSPFEYGDHNLGVNDQAGFSFATDPTFEGSQFQLPNRQRTPGAAFGYTNQSPNDVTQMDMTPDGSNGDQQTPSSTDMLNGSTQNISSHSSNTSYSPQNHQDQQRSLPEQTPGRLAGPSLFKPNDASFSSEFDIHNFPASATDMQSGFVLPQQWTSGGSTGLTPAASGFTPGAMNDVMNMSEQDWNQMLDGFSSENMAAWENSGGNNNNQTRQQWS